MTDRVRVRCKAVLFDLDDTLVDHRGAARDALATWAPQWGQWDSSCAADAPGLERRWQQLEQHYYRLFQARELTLAEQRRARVRTFLPHVDFDDAAADAAFEKYWAAYRRAWRPFPDALDALERARAAGLAVGVLTNGERAHQSAKLAGTGLAESGVSLLASSELLAAKPDPRAFVGACRILGIGAVESCVMVGDSWDNDILGALGAGLQAVFLDRDDIRRESIVPRVVSLAELCLDTAPR